MSDRDDIMEMVDEDELDGCVLTPKDINEARAVLDICRTRAQVRAATKGSGLRDSVRRRR